MPCRVPALGAGHNLLWRKQLGIPPNAPRVQERTL